LNDDAVFFLAEKLVSFPLEYPKEHEYMSESLNLAFVITGSGESRAEHDLGDAPDSSNSLPGATMLAYPSGVVANYPSVYEAGSPPYDPIHWQPNAMYHLGRIVTNESEADLGYDEDIKNNLIPPGDLSDLDGGDDGVTLTLVLPHCQEATFDYTVTVLVPDISRAIVNVWCDWNRDGDWDDVVVCPDGTTVPEWAVKNQMLLFMGPVPLTITTPTFMCWHPQTEAELDPMWMRITIVELPWGQDFMGGAAIPGGSAPADGYEYGETEDYLIYPGKEGEPLEYDWGDAPTGTVAAGYPTLAVTNGANHVIAGPWLGDENDRPESEPDGQPDPDALGDDNAVKDDENGVSIPILIPGQPVDITLEVSGDGGVVQAWIDFNSDMTWQPSEKIYDGFLPVGIHTLPVFVHDSILVGRTFARFRISKLGGLGPEGPAPDGEVEDHEVFVESMPQATSRPGSATQCPVFATQCPTVATQCVVVTMCPPVNTTCSAAQTQCSAVETQCPPAETKCPAEQTKCPPMQTRCPAVDTECPSVDTRCPAEKTKCPTISTQCPPVDTRCPGEDSGCLIAETKCPREPTLCYVEPTVCPEETQCPPVNTRCPFESTRCPPQLTRCPPGPTICYTEETQCPPQETECPPVDTRCPPGPTICYTEETQCPPQETECPPVDTRCPLIGTFCPRCPLPFTQKEAVEAKKSVVTAQCPAIEAKCPTIITKPLLAKTR